MAVLKPDLQGLSSMEIKAIGGTDRAGTAGLECPSTHLVGKCDPAVVLAIGRQQPPCDYGFASKHLRRGIWCEPENGGSAGCAEQSEQDLNSENRPAHQLNSAGSTPGGPPAPTTIFSTRRRAASSRVSQWAFSAAPRSYMRMESSSGAWPLSSRATICSSSASACSKLRVAMSAGSDMGPS